MSKSKTSRQPYRTLRGWAIGVLMEAHAIQECADHGHIRDRTDPHAWDHAREIARDQPFFGTPASKAVEAIDEIMLSLGDTCPECIESDDRR